jgi:hypothetical protein
VTRHFARRRAGFLQHGWCWTKKCTASAVHETPIAQRLDSGSHSIQAQEKEVDMQQM